jgi:hypothetical protein
MSVEIALESTLVSGDHSCPLPDSASRAIHIKAIFGRQCPSNAYHIRYTDNAGKRLLNLRRDTDPETECVRFDKTHTVRILERISAALDQFAAATPVYAEGCPECKPQRRSAEAPKQKRRLATRQERNA